MKLLRDQPDQKYVCFDTETESLNLKNSRPWEAAFVIFNQKEILDKIVVYPRWDDLNISEGARKITQFDETAYYEKATCPEEAFENVEKYLYSGDYKVVGQNILGFDIYQIANWAKAIGKKSNWDYLQWSFDTLSLARAIKSDRQPDLDNFLGWQFAMIDTKVRARCTLAQLASDYEIETEDDKLHQALYDTEINAKVFIKQTFDIEI